MRFLLLALALPLAACGVFDCPSAGPYETAEGTQFLRASPAVSDTLTVVVETGYRGYVSGVFVEIGAETPRLSESEETDIFVGVEVSGYDVEPGLVPRLPVEARSDTVVVRIPDSFAADFAQAAPPCARADGVVQPVCSYAEPEIALFFRGVTAPEGVRAVRYRVRDAYGRLAPMGTPSAPEATSSRPRRTARG